MTSRLCDFWSGDPSTLQRKPREFLPVRIGKSIESSLLCIFSCHFYVYHCYLCKYPVVLNVCIIRDLRRAVFNCSLASLHDAAVHVIENTQHTWLSLQASNVLIIAICASSTTNWDSEWSETVTAVHYEFRLHEQLTQCQSASAALAAFWCPQ